MPVFVVGVAGSVPPPEGYIAKMTFSGHVVDSCATRKEALEHAIFVSGVAKAEYYRVIEWTQEFIESWPEVVTLVLNFGHNGIHPHFEFVVVEGRYRDERAREAAADSSELSVIRTQTSLRFSSKQIEKLLHAARSKERSQSVVVEEHVR